MPTGIPSRNARAAETGFWNLAWIKRDIPRARGKRFTAIRALPPDKKPLYVLKRSERAFA